MLPVSAANQVFMQLQTHAEKVAHARFVLHNIEHECFKMDCADDHDPCKTHLMKQLLAHPLHGRLFPPPPENP